MKKGKLTDKVILFGRDLIKGYVTDKKYNNYFYSLSPWQMISLEEKTNEWFMWNMDWFEAIGLTQVQKTKGRILRNRRLASGILDPYDYVASEGDFSHLTNIIVPENNYDPLQQFYPIAPPIFKVLQGEFQKRDNHIQVECVDKYSIDEKVQYKEDLVKKAVMDYEKGLKEQALNKLGISFIPEEQLKGAPQDQVQQQTQMNQQFENEMNLHMKLIESEQKFKTYKHRMELWGQHILDIDSSRFYMDELESEGFGELLCNAREFWHIDLLEDDYRVELLDSANCFWHKTSNIKYISEGDYFGWFQDMTVGDIINKLGDKLTEEDFETIKSFLASTINITGTSGLLTNDQKAFSDAYYDTSQPYPFGAKNPALENTKERIYYENFLKENFQNYNPSTYEVLDQQGVSSYAPNMPKIFKVVRVYWRSQRKVGLLTKIDKSGVPLPGVWVDENFVITEKPIYDKSVSKAESKENLVYGEHIDWEWRNEWRHGIKIARNLLNKFWNSYTGEFNPIYIDGQPVKFQFKGKNNNMECLPPVEGFVAHMKGIREVSLIDLIAPYQVTYNICENKVPQIMARDFGKLMYHNQATIARNSPGQKTTDDYIVDFYNKVLETKIVPGNIDKDVVQALGANAGQVPQVIDMSIINEAMVYKQVGRMIKEDAYEALGITRQRLGQQKASETATGIEGAVNFSESQTEPLFTQHSNDLMPRVYQRMLEAAQYYLYVSKESRVMYRNSHEENVLLEVENMDGLLRDYNVRATNKPKVKVLKEKLEQLFLSDNTLEATSLERAEVISSRSVSEIMEKLRKAQARKEEMDREKMEREQEMQDKQIQAEKERLDAELKNTNEQNQLDRESQERIASLRMLMGMQTDVNANSVPDSQDNLDYYLKQQQIENQSTQTSNKLDFEKQKQKEMLELENKKLSVKQNIEQKKLAASLANQTSKDDKALNKSIAQSQGVINK